MKKKILMTAVVAAMAVPMVAAAEATIYGKLHVSVDDLDYGDSGAGVNLASDGYCAQSGADGADVCSRASRVGLKGSEDLGGGLKAIYKVEFGVQMADGDANILGEGSTTVNGRDMYVGLAGDWGTALIGRSDTPYKMAQTSFDIFSDQIGDMNFGPGFQDWRADNAIAYISPSFAGFTLAGAIVNPGGAGAALKGWNRIPYKGNEGLYGGSIPSFVTTEADGWADAWSIAANYKNGPFKAALGYESASEDLFCNKGVKEAMGGCYAYWWGQDAAGNYTSLDDWDKWLAGIGWSSDMFAVNFVYENQIDFQEIYYLNGQFNFGNNAIKAMYGWGNADSNGHKAVGEAVDSDSWAIGWDYNFSKRSTAYIQYADKDVDGKKEFGKSAVGDWSGWSLGMIHKF